MEMVIDRVKRHSEDQLLSNLRNVVMKLDSEARPYKDATINLRAFLPEEIAPAQRYILQPELEKVQALQWALERHEVDLFDLDGYVSIWVAGSEDQIDVLPPIVEVSREANGRVVNLLNDGVHRVYLAMCQWKRVRVAHIEGVPEKYPYYAYPVPNGWAGVQVIQELDHGMLKKVHRIPNNKMLYRDFNTGGFVNVGGPRPVTALKA